MFESFFSVVSCSIKVKIELQKHALSKAVRIIYIPMQKVLENYQIRDLSFNQVRILEFYSGLSTKDPVALRCLRNFLEQ